MFCNTCLWCRTASNSSTKDDSLSLLSFAGVVALAGELRECVAGGDGKGLVLFVEEPEDMDNADGDGAFDADS